MLHRVQISLCMFYCSKYLIQSSVKSIFKRYFPVIYSVAANKAVSGESKNPLDLIVVAQEIAASTAQLVVASRVKAPRDSNNLKALSTASKDVTQCTGAVVATAKDCSKRLEESQDLDLTKLTVHQAKTLEMEIQVKVLELEQALQTERSRLAAFRRKNYREN